MPHRWAVGDRFQLTADDEELVQLCNLAGIEYAGGFANGWIGTIVELKGHLSDPPVAVVNYDHKRVEARDAIPLDAAMPLSAVSDWEIGDHFRLTDDEGVLVRTCQLFRLGYEGGTAQGWEGTILEIETPMAIVHYSHNEESASDIIPLAAANRVSEVHSKGELASARLALTIAMEPPVDVARLKRALARGFQVDLDDELMRRAAEVFASCVPLDLKTLHGRELSERDLRITFASAGTVNYYFLTAESVMTWTGSQLPIYSHAKSAGMLVRLPIRRLDVCIGLYEQEYLAVSHRWNSPEEPDENGEQLCLIKAHLKKNQHIKYVFYDFSCLPQEQMTGLERLEFDNMLFSMNLIYLGCSVLVLMDRSTLCRFWTQFEAWLSMQSVGESGLEPASETRARYTICMQHGAPSTLVSALQEEWAKCSVPTACTKLQSPDVAATNLKDKEILIPRIVEFADEVRRNVIEIAIRREEALRASRRKNEGEGDRWLQR